MIFVTSDQHFNHKKIIEYQDRPFSSVGEMNDQLIMNWNAEVRPEDTVIFLGDIIKKSHAADAEDHRYAQSWLYMLHGNKILVQGNHDPLGLGAPYLIVDTDAGRLLMVHDPDNLPFRWNGWVVHGHHHKCHPDRFPLINYKNRTVNVSVELTKYRPVPLDAIVRMIRK